MLLATCRIKHPHLDTHPHRPPHEVPRIFYAWHQDLLPLLHFFRDTGIAPLISQSRDGERIAAVARLFGTRPVRGSSSRGGAMAFRALLRFLRSTPPTPVFITADGPKGPLHKLKEGTLLLGLTAQAQLIPVSWHCSSVWELHSWDRFRIPKPFSRVYFVLGPPILAPSLPADRSLACARLEQDLNGLRQVHRQ